MHIYVYMNPPSSGVYLCQPITLFGKCDWNTTTKDPGSTGIPSWSGLLYRVIQNDPTKVKWNNILKY